MTVSPNLPFYIIVFCMLHYNSKAHETTALLKMDDSTVWLRHGSVQTLYLLTVFFKQIWIQFYYSGSKSCLSEVLNNTV